MKLLACTLFVLLAVVSGTLAGCVPDANYEQWWMDRFNANMEYSRVNGSNVNLIFYGDFIVEGLPAAVWNRSFAPLGAVNYAIGSDLSSNVWWRIVNGEVADLSSRLVVVQIGSNNIGVNAPTSIAGSIANVVNDLRAQLPTARVLLLGILPRTDAATTALAEEVNQIISSNDNFNTVRFLNMRDSFYRNGQFISELYTSAVDPRYLSNLGYSRWEEAMYPLFNQMWNAPPLQ